LPPILRFRPFRRPSIRQQTNDAAGARMLRARYDDGAMPPAVAEVLAQLETAATHGQGLTQGPREIDGNILSVAAEPRREA
jgi:hypothetical protein